MSVQYNHIFIAFTASGTQKSCSYILQTV